MPAARYSVMPMREGDAVKLGPNVRSEDARECLDAGYSPTEALILGFNEGIAFTVWNWEDETGWEPIGCFGVDPRGCAWSLWDDLTPSDVSFIFRNTSEWLKVLLHFAAGKPLYNRVAESNSLARKWLERACNATFAKAILFHGRRYLPFTIAPAQAAP